MSKTVSFRLDEVLWMRCRAEAEARGQSYTLFVERALEQALAGDESGVLIGKVADPAPRRQVDDLPVGSAAPARTPVKAPAPYVRLLNPRPKGLR